MNDSERQRLSRFLDQLRAARASHPDAEAERLIRDAVAANSDAAYLLVQRAMLLEQALSNAKEQLSRMGYQRAASPPVGSNDQADPWAPNDRKAHASESSSPTAPPASRRGMSAEGTGGSFLTNVASTAAGVVAGSFLFQGIEHLLGHTPLSNGLHGDISGAGEETTINNFYGAGDDQGWHAQGLTADEMQDEGLDSFGDDTFLEGVDDSDWV